RSRGRRAARAARAAAPPGTHAQVGPRFCYGARQMRILLVFAMTLAACQQAKSKLDTVSGSGTNSSSLTTGSGSGATATPGGDDNAIKLDSTDILARTETAKEVVVKHVLIGWKDLPAARDPRAQKRDNAEAAKLAKDVLDQLKAK